VSALEDCCYRCVGCDRLCCRENDALPAEAAELLCADCYDTEDDE
jgi:hypothetical protein